MTEISIWQVIKVCIIILLLLIVVKKILKVWREHKHEVKIINDDNYRNDYNEQRNRNIETVMKPVSNTVSSMLTSPEYGNPIPLKGGDDFSDPDFDEYDTQDSFGNAMTGGSMFDVLSKIKNKPKKKSIFKSKATKKKGSTSKKTSSKKR